MPYWLESFFTFLPAYALFFAGVGLPWALILLPRDEWRNLPTVVGLGLALGPLLSTTWLFILGTWGRFEVDKALTGIVMLSVVGITGAWLRRHTGYRDNRTRPEPYSAMEKILLVMMVLAFIVHIYITMFWPFHQYDTLWTFGYNPRVFLIYENIPDWIDYYPQLVPLTYTYGQLLNGEINDYVARAAVPWFFLSSILMAFLLGSRVWGKRRIGILTAALWMLVPSALYWSGSGDLEHPVTIYFTGALIFFILAWRGHNPRHAVISGLLFAGAAWTKPTAGAFALGVMLVMAVMALRLVIPNRLREQLGVAAFATENRTIFWQKFQIAAITGLTSLPIGLMWYARNYAVGHEPIRFPLGYWTDFAQRSGQELGWPMLIAALAVGMGVHRLWEKAINNVNGSRRRVALMLLGLALFLGASLPSALVLNEPWTSDSAYAWVFGARTQDSRLGILEVIAIIGGLSLIAWQLLPLWQKSPQRVRSSAWLSTLLILPFAVYWFWNYSYHYRLMLAITPALAAMVAGLLDGWFIPFMLQNRPRRWALHTLTVALSVPALVVASNLTIQYHFITPAETTREKYEVANPALMEVVALIEQTIPQKPVREGQLNIYALHEMRLNFFFPEMRSLDRDSLPLNLNELPNLTDLVVRGDFAEFIWREEFEHPNQLTAQMEIGWHYSHPRLEYAEGRGIGTFFSPIAEIDDGNNRYVVFEVYYPFRQYAIEEIAPPFTFADDQWGFLALRGAEFREVVPDDSRQIVPDETGVITLEAGQRYYLQSYWQRPTDAPIERDYHIYMHLIDPQTGDIVAQSDGSIAENRMPLSTMPYPDLVFDRRVITIPPDVTAEELTLRVGLYDPLSPVFERVEIVDGPFAGEDGVTLEGRIRVVGGG